MNLNSVLLNKVPAFAGEQEKAGQDIFGGQQAAVDAKREQEFSPDNVQKMLAEMLAKMGPQRTMLLPQGETKVDPGIGMYMHFYRNESARRAKEIDSYGFKNKSGNVHCSATKPKYGSHKHGGYSTPVELGICEDGLAAWGLHKTDIPYDGIVRIRLSRFEIEVSTCEVKVEERPFKPPDVPLKGPDRKKLIQKARANRVREDDEDDEEEIEEEDDG